ncbi:peptide chain release factor N(5)-glutamine methyltransferase [Thermoanaerobacter thermocopriae]|uniref:peptide chain release factor N(5)-glutamine methyltransferase n=1 Tax=Thermoanaerobacter thermocopriae TaxID=29350 RepID=UPI0039088FAA
MAFSHCFKINRTALFLRREEEISKEQLERFLEFVNMRKSHIPYQYIVKKQYFMGLEFFVDENVLIPRPETEILVEEALKRLKRGDVVLDIGTGSGAIAVSIAKYFPDCTVYAVDISKKAIEIAKHNAKKQGVLDRIFFIESDLFCNLPPNLKFDFIVSNPPYIKKREIELLQEEVKKEPIVALDGGEDGLFFYKKIIREAPFYIKSGGKIGFEIGYSQKEEVTTLLEESGFKDVEIIKDLAGIDRVIIAEHKL